MQLRLVKTHGIGIGHPRTAKDIQGAPHRGIQSSPPQIADQDKVGQIANPSGIGCWNRGPGRQLFDQLRLNPLTLPLHICGMNKKFVAIRRQMGQNLFTDGNLLKHCQRSVTM